MNKSPGWRSQQVVALSLLCGHASASTAARRRSVICHHCCDVWTVLVSALPTTARSRLPSSMLDSENLNSDSTPTVVARPPQKPQHPLAPKRSAAIAIVASWRQHRRRSRTQQRSLVIIFEPVSYTHLTLPTN